MARIAAILVALVTGALLIFIVLSHFVTGVMADRRIEVNRDVLTAMAKFFPNSSRVYTRLAEAEMSEIADYERDTASAEEHALRAIRLSPWDYNLRLLLASAREARGDREAAEDALHQALKLAPNYTEVHWSLANMLLRTGRFKESLDEFRVAVADNLAVLPAALKLVWNTSNGEVEATSAITSGEPPARLVLAQFLLTHARVAEAAQVFSQIERNARLDSPHSARFLDTLITTDHVGLARNLWVDLMTGETSASHPLIWNGSFEFDIAKGLAQFDWTLGRSEYARLTIDTSLARTGARSLKIDFAGRDTTRLDTEIRQLIAVRPGTHYRLECYAKTKGLVTPEGPRVVLTSHTSSTPIAASAPVAAGSSDWQRLVVDFVTPADLSALFVTIKRTPKFSYDEPTSGTIWFDDFTMAEQ